MKLETKIKQILVTLLGNCIMGAGVAMGSQALLGTDPSVSFSQAACVYFNISFGQMITITNITLLVLVFFIKRKNIGLSTLFVVLLNQYPVDFFTSLISHSDSLIINILWVLAGIVCVAIGCNIMIASKLGMGIYDAFVFGIADKVGKSFVFIRYIVDGVFLALTFVFKGYVGVGTILPYLLTGNLMKLTMPYIEKVFNFE